MIVLFNGGNLPSDPEDSSLYYDTHSSIEDLTKKVGKSSIHNPVKKSGFDDEKDSDVSSHSFSYKKPKNEKQFRDETKRNKRRVKRGDKGDPSSSSSSSDEDDKRRGEKKKGDK